MRKTMITAVAASAALAAGVATMPADATDGAHAGKGPVPRYKVVAQNLHNPRQITFAHGDMYVAEAGQGGHGACLPDPEAPPPAQVCYGPTGSVTRVRAGKQHRVLKGLPSIGAEGTGSSSIGPSDLAVVGKHTLVVSIGFGSAPKNRAMFSKYAQKQLAHLMSFNLATGKRTSVGDLGRHEAKTNPVDNRDTDPSGVAKAGKLGFVVTDSGGNTVVSAKAGKVKSVAAFQDRKGISPITGPEPKTYQSVPTDIVRGPDGAWYVSELTGFPFIQGAARIWRIVPGHKPHVWAKGLTNVTSLAFDGKRLYAVQISDAGLAAGGPPIGSLRRVFPKSSGKASKPIVSGVFAPYGVAIHHGAAYLSTGSVDPANGSVIKVPLG